MLRKKYYRLLFYGILVVVAAGGYYLQQYAAASRPFPDQMKILVKTDYILCKHQNCSEATPLALKVLTLHDLRELYSSQEGWRSRYENDQVIVSRTLESICPKCSRVTHLGEKGGFVAVIRGPAGVNGEIVRVTKIRVNSLPKDMRRKAQDGVLDLPDEEALLQILDSLEESGR